jgi:peptide/nickel transport system substrate-binding protein
MTMDDVLYSMERIANPDTASYLGWMYDNVASMEQTGDWELTVTLAAPDATWQYVPGTTACHVISKAHAEAAGDQLGTPEGGLMGTAPYKFVSWQNGTSVELTRNENYWGEDAGYYDNLTFSTERKVQLACPQLNSAALEACGFVREDKLQVVEGAHIFPCTYFDPLSPGRTRNLIGNDTVSIHHYSASWQPAKNRWKRKLIRFIGQERIAKIKEWLR